MQKNIYRNDRQILKDIIPLEMPLVVSIEPSNLCNFKCKMCFHGNNEKDERAKPLSNMSNVIFDKTIKDLYDWVNKTHKKIKLVKLYSLGEPLLNKNLAYMVKRIKELDVAGGGRNYHKWLFANREYLETAC